MQTDEQHTGSGVERRGQQQRQTKHHKQRETSCIQTACQLSPAVHSPRTQDRRRGGDPQPPAAGEHLIKDDGDAPAPARLFGEFVCVGGGKVSTLCFEGSLLVVVEGSGGVN